jgi:flagellar biosynthesis/type III secretory pathway M-ring protein FliF/YscJ
MEAIKLLASYWESLKRLGIYADYCARENIGAPACHDFWMFTVVLALGISLLILFVLVRGRLLEYRKNRERELQLAEAARVADEKTMNQHKWVGDEVADVQRPHSELVAEIQAALRSRQDIQSEKSG